MSAGLAALLDDIAALAKLTAASLDDVGAAAGRASAKAAGVVVDDTAVTPRYVQGVDPKRELPIIGKIARGSIINKLLIILPLALLISQFVPWLMTPILMLGGTYLCFEGAEKIYEHFSGKHEADKPAVNKGEAAEKKVISGAVRTDFILSAEIMVISLNEVASEPLVNRAATLVVIAVLMTLLVYGVVALIVKMDDIGLAMARGKRSGSQKFGQGLVKAMPKVLTVISVVGVFAMLWVGGHIILMGLKDLGFSAPYEFVHHLEVAAASVPGIGGFLGWLTNTFFSLILGVIWGAVIVALLHLLPKKKKKNSDAETADSSQVTDPLPEDQNPSGAQ